MLATLTTWHKMALSDHQKKERFEIIFDPVQETIINRELNHNTELPWPAQKITDIYVMTDPRS